MSDANDVLTGSAAPRAEQESVEQTSTTPELPEADVPAEAAEEPAAVEDAPAPEPAAEAVEPAEAEAPFAEESAVEPVAEVAPEPPAESAAVGEAEAPFAEESAVEPVAEVAPEPPAESAAVGEAEAPFAEEVAAEPPAESTAVGEAEAPFAEEIAAEPMVEAAQALTEVPAEVAAPAQTTQPRAAKPAPPAVSSDEDTHSVETTDAAGQRVVRTLAVGQEVQGTVKRVSDFGAFVDIGVGRDGLVHISELSVRRIGKVTDVLKEGDEVTLWIKKLDRERNRISLTMIPPGTRTMRDLQKDDVVPGTVTRLLPYGAFVDIGVGRDALLHVREMGERFVAKPEDVVKVGEILDVRIIEIQRRRGRIDLSIKGLREEPEPEPAPQASAPAHSQLASQPEPEPEMEDPFADIEPISAMEAAWKKAVEASGGTYKPGKKGDKRERDRRDRQRQMQEEIMNRTLKQGK